MRTKKYNDYDNLTLYVKKVKAQQIIENYKTFGWQLVSEADNKQYEDIVDLTFERPHKTENKDELQLMQVYMEDKLNAIGKLEKNKHPKTTSFGLIFGVMGLALIVFAILFNFGVLASLNTVYCIVMGSVGLLFLILTFIVIPKLYKKELNHFKTTHAVYEMELKEICKKATTLSGGENNGN